MERDGDLAAERAAAARAASMIRRHLAKHGHTMSEAMREKHEAVARRKEAESGQ